MDSCPGGFLQKSLLCKVSFVIKALTTQKNCEYEMIALFSFFCTISFDCQIYQEMQKIVSKLQQDHGTSLLKKHVSNEHLQEYKEVGEENKIKKLRWRMEKECPQRGNECKGKRESQSRKVEGSLMTKRDVLQKNKNTKPLM